MQNSILNHLAAGATVVCATERHARELRQAYAEYQRDEGATLWTFPPIVSLRNWLIEHWELGLPEAQMLHPSQELALWLYVVEAEGGAKHVLSPMALARQAREADRLVCEYLIELDEPGVTASQEYAAFWAWRQAYEKRLAAKGWTTAERVGLAMLERAQAGQWTPSDGLVFVGFRELTPQQAGLVDAFKGQGLAVEVLQEGESEPASEIKRYRYNSAEDEACAAAKQIASILSAYTDSPEQAPRIGVVVPEIGEWRDTLEAAFVDAICPDALLPGGGEVAKPWTYSRGQLLSEHPVIHIALDVIALQSVENEINQISRVLLSPLLWSQGDEAGRARVDWAMRERGGIRCPLKSLQRLFKEAGVEATVAGQLRALAREIAQGETAAYPSEWGERYEARLHAVGWLISGDLPSEHYQVREAWRESLRRFAAMDSQLGRISAGRAVSWLREILASRDFQVASEAHKPVRVIEYADVADARFEHAVVLGLSSDVLPRGLYHSPFVTREALAAAGVPLTTPEDAQKRAETLVTDMLRLAPAVWLTCSGYDSNGAMRLPATVAGPWPEATEGQAERAGYTDSITAAGVMAEMPNADPVPPVADDGRDTVRGGVSVISNYQVMPYLAYVRSRLGVQPFPSVSSGIDARTQGNLVHDVLDKVWAELVSQDKLLSLTTGQIQELVADEVSRSCEDRSLLPAAVYGRYLAEMERARVTALVCEWLAYEAERVQPFRVVARECDVRTQIGPLRVRLRLDRVDEITLDNGRKVHLCLDYKTGSWVDTRGWDPHCLTEPQLPLYVVTDAMRQSGLPDAEGIALAHVVEGRRRFMVRSNFAGALHADRQGRIGEGERDWDALVDAWREALVGSAEGVIKGYAVVDADRLEEGAGYDDVMALMRMREVKAA